VAIEPRRQRLTAVQFARLERALSWYRRRRIKVERVMSDNGSPDVSKAFAATFGRASLKHLRFKSNADNPLRNDG
jgi:hypothetical protein